MVPENPPHTAKVDTWMPLDIGRFLQDTLHLGPAQIGNYILLLMHYWTHGALQNDPQSLARIAREQPDAWSIAQAKLSMFFSIGEDGLLHQSGADRRMAEWRDKRQKAKEKASKAARARWERYRANKERTVDAPSIAQAVLEQCPSPVVQVQKQKQKQDLPPTPTAARRGIGEAPTAVPGASPAPQPGASLPGRIGEHAPSMQALPGAFPPGRIGEHAPSMKAGNSSSQVAPTAVPGASPAPQPGASLPGRIGEHAPSIPAASSSSQAAAAVPGASRSAASGGHRSANKAKPGESRPAGAANSRNDAEVTAGHGIKLHPGLNGSNGHHGNRPHPSKTDARRKTFEGEIFRYWASQNPDHPDLQFRPADHRALDDLLRAYPDLTLSLFRHLLKNRAQSHISPAALPHKWLRNVMEYVSGPLGKYGKQLERSRVV